MRLPSMLLRTFQRAVLVAAVITLHTSNGSAQPTISYIIPDLGTTRYATYVEIVGPYNRNGNFGSDGFYLNNPGDAVRVRCARPADTSLVKVGPCVVSWNGRLISTTIFVVPTAAPNSEDWTQLAPQFRIPLVVEANGQISAADTFYIVRPSSVGDKRSSPERTIGEGSLGRRSKRGAMIIDSLLMAGADYQVSTIDCDPLTPGNQGYLPFVLLSPGRIIGQNGCTIRASANGSNGGPGGGGGGGAVFNAAVAGSSGTDGGAGYTGGGPGGENAAIGSNSRRKPGVGSGAELPVGGTRGSASLNGQPGGDLTSAYENAGGGTGHPFGESGVGCDNKDACSPAGGYGGGSGGREGQAGSGGGHAEAGTSSPGLSNGGKIVGNTMIVPLAGGSGGAGGNPSGIAGKGSAGGGGGGAVSIHAKLLGNFDVFANGATASLQDIPGGGGSGGAVIMGSRLDNVMVGSSAAQASAIDRPPHLRGGRGRTRYDFWLSTTSTSEVGILSDTLTVSLRDVSIIGNGSGQDILVFVKPERGEWMIRDTIKGYAPNGRSGSWRYSDRLPGTDTLYFIAFGLLVPNPSTAQFTAEPAIVFSQSGWNIVRLKGPPIIQSDTVRNLGIYRCPGEVMRDTIVVQNLGESPLEITSAVFIGAAGFSLVEPKTFPDSIQSNDSKTYIIEYSPPTPATSGTQATRLVLDNTDTAKARDPWYIQYNVDVRPVSLTYRFRGGVQDTIDLGPLCVNQPLADQIVVENTGLDPVTLLRYSSANEALVEASANLPFTVPIGGFRNLNFQIIAKRVGPGIVATLLEVQGCTEPDTVWIRFEGVAPALTVAGSGQFGLVPVGGTKQLLLQLSNNGSSDLDLQALPAVPAPFRLVSATPTLPRILAPGATIELVFEYAPTVAGDHQAALRVRSTKTTGFGGRSCADSVQIVLAGSSQPADVIAVPGSVSFVPTRPCTPQVELVTVQNIGATPVQLRYPAFINGTHATDFSITRQPNDTTLPPGGQAIFEITFLPAAAAATIRTAILSVRTDVPGLPQLDVPLNGTIRPFDLQGARYVDMGLIPVGVQDVSTELYTNATGSDLTITQIRSSRPAVLQATPAPFTIADGASQTITISVTPDAEMTAVDTLWFVSSSPCADSFPVLVRWTSESASLGITNTVDFGNVAECIVKIDTVYVSNTSKVPVDVISVAVGGPDAVLFRVLNAAVATNVTLGPGERIAIAIEFDPRGVTDGVKDATLTVRARLNNVPTSFVSALRGVRTTSIPGTPGPVIFGFVDVSAASNQTFTVVNTSAVPVRITGITLRGTSGGVFTFLSGTVPVTLQPGERFDVQVVFTPTDKISYTDTLLIAFDQPCDDVKAVALSGTGRLNVEFEIRMPQIVVLPSEDNLVIPVRAQIVSGAATSVSASGRLIIRYLTSLFVIQRVSPGVLLRNVSTGGITEIEVELTNVTITDQETVLFELIGQATLGSVDSTDLDIAFAEMSQSGSTYTTRQRDGWLKIDICEEGGQRLVTKAGILGIQPQPSPVTDVLTVLVDVFEKGIHTLELVDVHGATFYSTAFTHQQGDPQRHFMIDSRSLASGMYTLRLSTPTRQRMATVLVVH